MCGIFGAIGDATDEALSRGRDALLHRGPDASGVWRDGPFGFSHTRLKVIDLSEAARQPMPGCTSSVQLTFNGEIYNHHALRRELEGLGHNFRSRSDTEVIVHGYEAWGDAVVERIDGMFALGLWDGKQRRLLLARDRTGKKPLFYTLSDDRSSLRFASEVKALHAAGHPDEVDVASLPMFLAWGYVPAPATLHLGVLQLAPATRLVFTPGAAPRSDVYWRPTFRDPPLAVDFDEACRHVRELLVAAVERRLEADVPLGAFLSGGIDSTIIVGIMTRLLGRRVRTFSIGFPDSPSYDEAPAAQETARLFGTTHTEFTLAPASIADIERLVWLHDGPFGDSSALPTAAVSRLTKEHVTVALSGDGGDELFAGYLRFLAGEAAELVPRVVRRGLARLGGFLPAGLPVHSIAARGRRFLVAGDRSLADRMSMWSSSFATELDALFEPGVVARDALDAPRRWQADHFTGAGSPLASILDHNFRTYLAYDLQTKLDRCSAGNALEVRSPFLDTALVEYAGRLPDRFRRRGTRTKHVLRAAFADLIPAHIARRPKRGFAVPLATWFRGELRTWVEAMLGPQAGLYAWVRRKRVAKIVEEHMSGRFDRSQQLWTLLTLEIWLRARVGSNAVLSPRSAVR